MTINEHAFQFAGKPVVDWEEGTAIEAPEQAVYRLSLSYEEADEGQRWSDKLALFLEDPAAARVTGLVVGSWGMVFEGVNSAAVVEALVAARERLPRLAALFLGDIIMEESEISWIEQTDVSPLFEAYPALEYFTVRGGNRLSLGSLRHGRLKSLVIESGGLDVGVVRQVLAAELPELEHLELWLGSEHYGATTTVEDLAPLFAGHLFPRLRYLGLKDSEFADAIAGAMAQAPIVERIRVLDLSLGTLGDEGAAALLASPAVARLELLDFHHHFCSREMVARLEKAGIRVNAGDRQKEEVYGGERWRYVAVSE